jgi:hypothetical protein
MLGRCVWVGAALSTLAMLASCSGDEFASGTGGSGGSGASGSGGSATGGTGAGPPGVCPGTQPTAGSACPTNDLFCTFGNDARPNCRVHVRCVGDTWSIVREPNCSFPLPCEVATVTGAQCLTKGDECSGTNLYCACTCTPGCGSYTWKCPAPGAGCPPVAPNAGTGCAAEGTSCTYGVCDDETPLHDQVVVQCQGGSWTWVDTSCLS